LSPEWKRILSWSLYDFGNSAFATTVMAGLFPLFFKEFWSAGVDVTESTFKLGLANSLSGLLVVLFAPFLGAIADRGQAKKSLLFFFTGLGCLMTIALYFVGQGGWFLAAAFFIAGTVGFSGGNIFYDALILDVVREDNIDFVSALGYSLGYLGGGILFTFNVIIILKPGLFGLMDKTQAIRFSFLTVGIWWALFTIPLLLWVKEKQRAGRRSWILTVKGAMSQLAETFSRVRHLKVVSLFLLGYWLYIDGVYTIIRMAVDYGISIGLDSNRLILALLMVQFVGFPAALIFGKLGQRAGPKIGIYIGITVYVFMTVWAYRMDSEAEFFAMAVSIGLVQGGIQSLSRSYYARIIPQGQSAEFFGFYNMVGKFAAVFGPLLVGWTALITGDPRKGIFSITVLLLLGSVFLFFVDEKEGREMAKPMEEESAG